MIEYVVEHNPDDRILNRASRILKNGGLICFPTETNWVIVCDPYQKQAVDSLYRMRNASKGKHLTVLCDTFQKAMEIALIDDSSFRLIKKVIPGSYTFIFEAQKKITKVLQASKTDKEIGIRFPPNFLCRKLIELHGDVLLSTHLVPKMMDLEEDETIYSVLIEDTFGQNIDLILDTGEYEFSGSTSIISFVSGAPEVLREGAGNIELFQN